MLISKLKIYTELGQDRTKIIETLNTKYKEYLPNLLTEKTTLQQINEIQEIALKQIQERALEEAIQETVTQLTKEQLDLQMEYADVVNQIANREAILNNKRASFNKGIFKHNILLQHIHSEEHQNSKMVLDSEQAQLDVIKLRIAEKGEEIDKLYENTAVVEILQKIEADRIEKQKEANSLALAAALAATAEAKEKERLAKLEKEENDRISSWWDGQLKNLEKGLLLQKIYSDNLTAEMEIRDEYKDLTSPEATLESELETYMTFYENRNELVKISEQEHADIIAHYQGQISDRNKYEVKQRVGDTVSALSEMGSQFKAFKKVAQAAQIADTIFSTYGAAQAAYENWIKSKLPLDPATKQALGVASAALAVGQGMARVSQIKKAAAGADYIADSPQMLMVGEQGLRERVQVTPLDGVNIEGGTQGITLNISGNVLTDSFVEESIVPSLREALRQGEVLA